MGLLIEKSDFVDTFALSKSIEDTIDAYIDKYEEGYLQDLLGVELYDLFAADVVGGVPVSPIYLSIYNKFAEDYNYNVLRSLGMKSMLLGFVWFQYVRETAYKHTGTGVVTDVNEISKNDAWTSGYIYKKYNESIQDYRVIQWYICENKTDYPTYNGVNKLLNGVV